MKQRHHGNCSAMVLFSTSVQILLWKQKNA